MKELFKQAVLAGRFEDAYPLFCSMDFLVASGILVGLTARDANQRPLHFVEYLTQRQDSRRMRQLYSALAQGCYKQGVS
ncbi:hypothetical protein [Azotosporobacter soli]|uniref:hypothetical protein n=1 Tax=Azotosporobacter soli TaxID=3055040 RepID=UPI0031FE610F